MSVGQRRAWTENEIAKEAVDAAYRVHTGLGPGLLETVYEVALAHELKKRGMTVVRLADKRLGLLINFGQELIKDGVKRIVNGLRE